MNALHSLLKRQLRRFANDTIPLIEEQTDFIRVINDAYWQFDADRKMLEHSLELTSQELLEKNTELSNINADLEMRVMARAAELSNSEARFRGLFEHVPVSIWEEDFSAVRQYINKLRDQGVIDFSSYFDEHPDAVAECAGRVKIVDVNRATLHLYQAENKRQLLKNLSQVLGPESVLPFKEELLALIRGDTIFETELINYTLRGEKRAVFVRLTVAPGCEQTWARIFVGISDITARREAESALATERDLLQALMDNIPDTIYFKDTSSRFMRINRAQAKVLGVLEPEDAIGKTDLDFQDPKLAQSFYEEEQRLVLTGEPLVSRIEFNPTPDGQPRWFSATKVPIKDETGRVIGIVGISHDITKRKQTEDALRQSEERFNLISWATKDAVWDWNLQTNRVWWGEGLQKIFRYSSDMIETSAEWWFKHIHPDDLVKVKSTIDQALEHSMEFWSKEYRFQRNDGTYANIMNRGYILINDLGEPYRIIGAMMDITDRKQAEQALLESEGRYRQIVQSAGDLIYRVDIRGRLTYVNPTALRIMGYNSEAEVLGHHYSEFVHPAWRERVRFTYSRQFAEKTLTTYFEFLALTHRRHEIWLGQTAQILLKNNRVTGFQVVGRDVSAQKEAEVALQEANWKMAQSLTELQSRNREIALRNELSHLLQGCQSEEEAYRVIADSLNRLFPGTAGAFYVLSAARTSVRAVAAWGDLSSSERTFAPMDCCALRRGKIHLFSENQSQLPCPHLSTPLPVISYCLPIEINDEIIGALHIQSRRHENLDEAKRQLADAVDEQIGMTLSNLKLREALREQSIRDPLTGLYNRRYMEEVLKQQVSHFNLHLHPLGIMMLDIDHFKRFNDTYGHAEGDLILGRLGQFLRAHIRAEDIACRYGGEEFMLIMPDVTLEVAQQRAEHLRQAARQLQVYAGDRPYEEITLSLGVAVYPLHGRTIETVLRAADDALYRAKQEGRNQVVIAGNPAFVTES